ncbi:MAG: xanthine dehydrogenase family protein subunit M [Chloroflexi bacterium]|nr:xanthine dehydrogenase family protein subunit M [Chloroflexota bacterium]
MRDFSYHAPASLAEAHTLLAQYGDDARLMAGGTALTVMLKQSLVQADHLVSLQRIPGLRRIHLQSDGLHIGALARLRDVETSPLVKEHAPLLAEVYRQVATVRIRNQATVGGGIIHADPAQDPPPALLVLDARLRLVSRAGQREVPVREFFLDYYETALRPGEVLTEVIVPLQTKHARAIYLRYTPRTQDDYPTVSVAALARVERGVCREVRVALGAAAPTALRVTAVEEALGGKRVSQAAVRRAAALVAEQITPLEDFRGSADYKRDMAVVFTRRALEGVLGLG